MSDAVSKSTYARMRNLSPGRISQLIRSGTIGPEAIVGTGHRARINVEIADRHLAERLDATRRGAAAPAAPEEFAASGDAPPSLLSERLRREGLQSELLQIRLAQKRGELVSRQAALDAMETAGRSIAAAISALPGMAEEIHAAAMAGGAGAIASLLRAKALEIQNRAVDLLVPEAPELEPLDDDDEEDAE